MSSSLLSTMFSSTYSRSTLLYRIGLVREFLEFVFFSMHKDHAEKSLVKDFCAENKKDAGDAKFLGSLPEDFFAVFSKDSFYDVLSKATEEIDSTSRPLSITAPVAFSEEQIAEIGTWVRKELGPSTLIDFSVEPSIALGCQFVWEDTLYDYSFGSRMNAKTDIVHNRIQYIVHSAEKRGKNS